MKAVTVTDSGAIAGGSERIRVLRIVARMNVGGPAAQIAELARGMDRTRFEQVLISGWVGHGEADFVELRAPDVRRSEVRYLARTAGPVKDATAYRKISSIIRDFSPHIVHTHTAKAGVLGRIAAIRSNVPVTVHTYHGHLLRGYFSPPVRAAIVAAERSLARRTDRLIAVGRKVRDELLQAGIGRSDQFEVIAPGITLGTNPSRAAARSELGIPESTPVLSFVGRLTKIKRPDRMLEVAQRLRRSFPDILVLVAGGGDNAEQVRNESLRDPNFIRMLGWRRDVANIYAASDLVLLTSDNEGMPVSLIEAASVGCPAVACDVGSVSEVVLDGKTGFACPSHVEALAEAASRLLTSKSLQKEMGDAAKDFALTEFSPTRLVAETEDLYSRLLMR